MLGLNARFDALGKELFQARVLEAREHTSSVTRVVTIHKSPHVPAVNVGWVKRERNPP